MSQQTESESDTLVLRDISWDQYKAILEALSNHHLKHHYAAGQMELRRQVNDVTWKQYTAFLEAIGDAGCRHCYSNGTLEMMSPRKDHDWLKRFVGRIVEQIAFEFDINIQCIGSTTITSEAVGRGFQPDEAYYIANESAVRGKEIFEPDVDPPPDLLIEVDLTSSSTSRLPCFAAMRVPEVWRVVDFQVEFLHLGGDSQYSQSEFSHSLPMLKPANVNEALERLHEQTENKVLRDLIAKLRSRQ